uniref:Peptidase_M14 domain-containing protein n=1 Tax=Strongyloides papillosus TaxID=174720 RepID=A0A0N5CHM2_STREA
MFLSNVVFIFLFFVKINCYVDYSNYSLFNILIRNEKDLRIYEDLEKKFPGEKLDFWFQGRSPGFPIKLFTSPKSTIKIKDYLNVRNYDFNITTKDWNEMSPKPKTIRRLSSNLNYVFQHNIFLSYDEIIDFLKLKEQQNKEFVSLRVYGESYEKRLLYYVKIGYSNGKEKPMVVIDGGMHAREWVTHSSMLFIIDHIIKNIKNYKEILEKFDIVIFPVLNPDGYVYSRIGDRMWRGNRNLNNKESCGVDLNRNYPFMWKEHNGICLTYPGTFKLSELESMYHSIYVERNIHLIKGYITFHSYGRLILLPWIDPKKRKEEYYDEMISLGNKMKKEISYKKGSSFGVGDAAEILYPTNGASDDYIKSLGVKYVYTVELSPDSDTYSNGFIVKEDQITTIGEEALIIFDIMLHQVYSEL